MSQSQALFQQAQQYLPGGVNSPVRAFGGVDGEPVFFQRAQGAYLWDVDAKQHIDYVGSWGPMIAGHAHPHVIEAITEAAQQGVSFGAPCEAEVRLAQRLCQHMPSMEMVRMVNSGTEATTTAIRLARGFTQRSKIVKFIGCYHGHCDALLVKAGSGALTHQQPDSAGIPSAVTADTILLEYNNTSAVAEAFGQYKDQIAAVIVEPIAGNMGMVLPHPEFLSELRQQCDRWGALLIFDEVMTGFRVALGGAQSLFSITPDITTLGKIIGGGCPVGALGGRRDIMTCLSPLGPVYQAGTLSGNPLAMAAGLATMDLIEEPGFYEQLSSKVTKLVDGLSEQAARHQIPLLSHSLGGMFGFFFSELDAVNQLSDVQQSNRNHFKIFFHGMLDQGVYLAPSPYEAGFVSQAHTLMDIDKTIEIAGDVMGRLPCVV